MQADQKGKLNAVTTRLLFTAWTLTQTADDAGSCSTGASASILSLAADARPSLFDTLFPFACHASYDVPNIIEVDNVAADDNLPALAMAFNAVAVVGDVLDEISGNEADRSCRS